MISSPIFKSILLFVAAGICEIGGGYLVWLWLRNSKGLAVGILGGLILFLYGVIPTLHLRTLGESMPRMAVCSLCCPYSGVGK